MKIIHLAQRYWPHGGGVEYHLQELNKQLLGDGHTVSVITEQHDVNLPLSELHDGVTILRIPQVKTLFKVSNPLTDFLQRSWQKLHRWWFMFRLIPFFKQADIVQVHDVFWWIVPMWWLIPSKVYMTFHGYERELGPTLKQQRWHQLAAALTDGSIGVGGFHEEWYGVKPSVITFGAADFKQLTPESDHVYPNHEGIVQVVFIGRLEELTGAQELVMAVAALPEALRSTLRVSIYGDGLLRQELASIVEHQHLPITLHGYQPDARQYLRSADIICVSQYLALLEGLASERPILSFAGSDFKEAVLRSTPYQADITITRSIQELATHLQNHLTDQPLTSTSQQTLQWVREQTWQTMTQTYYALWNEQREEQRKE